MYEHCASGHQALRNVLISCKARGITFTQEAIQAVAVKGCKACNLARQRHAPIKSNDKLTLLLKRAQLEGPVVVLVFDQYGPIAVESAEHLYRYALVFWAPKTSLCFVLGTRRITADEIEKACQRLRARLRFRLGEVRMFKVDGLHTTSTNTRNWVAYLNDSIIGTTSTPPYRHQYLDVEQFIGRLVPSAVASLLQGDGSGVPTPRNQWYNALLYQAITHNMMPSRQAKVGGFESDADASPMQRAGISPTFSLMFPFFSMTDYVLDESQRDGQFVATSARGHYVRPDDDLGQGNKIVVYNPNKGRHYLVSGSCKVNGFIAAIGDPTRTAALSRTAGDVGVVLGLPPGVPADASDDEPRLVEVVPPRSGGSPYEVGRPDREWTIKMFALLAESWDVDGPHATRDSRWCDTTGSSFVSASPPDGLLAGFNHARNESGLVELSWQQIRQLMSPPLRAGNQAIAAAPAHVNAAPPWSLIHI